MRKNEEEEEETGQKERDVEENGEKTSDGIINSRQSHCDRSKHFIIL